MNRFDVLALHVELRDSVTGSKVLDEGEPSATPVAIPNEGITRKQLRALEAYEEPGTPPPRHALQFDRGADRATTTGLVQTLFGTERNGASTVDTWLSFIHLADSQIREEGAKLFGETMSVVLDKLVPTVKRDVRQEENDIYVQEALIRTINEDVRAKLAANDPSDPPAAFVVHGGDAVDAGLLSEMHDFHRIFDGLDVPWINQVGNHDVVTFGIFPRGEPHWLYAAYFLMKKDLTGDSPSPVDYQGYLAGDRLLEGYDDFRDLHRDHNQDWVAKSFNAAGKVFVEDPTHHGLDLNGGRGYYAMSVEEKVEVYPAVDALPKVEASVVLITLQTSDLGGGHNGTLDQAQLSWLDSTLGENSRNLVLVFGHHPIKSLKGKSGDLLLKLLFEHPNVLGYFAGHTHKHEIRAYLGEEGQGGFWEVVTGAVLAYPQQGRQVRLKSIGDGVGFIELVTFSQSVDPETALGKLARIGFLGSQRDPRSIFWKNWERRGRVRNDVDYGIEVDYPVSSWKDTNVRLFFRLPPRAHFTGEPQLRDVRVLDRPSSVAARKRLADEWQSFVGDAENYKSDRPELTLEPE